MVIAIALPTLRHGRPVLQSPVRIEGIEPEGFPVAAWLETMRSEDEAKSVCKEHPTEKGRQNEGSEIACKKKDDPRRARTADLSINSATL